MGGFPLLGLLTQQSFPKLDCVHMLNGLALPCASHSGEITVTLADSRRLHFMLVAALVLFAHLPQ